MGKRRSRRRNPSIGSGWFFLGGAVTGGALVALGALVLFAGPKP